jgi:hypothetical protein
MGRIGPLCLFVERHACDLSFLGFRLAETARAGRVVYFHWSWQDGGHMHAPESFVENARDIPSSVTR